MPNPLIALFLYSAFGLFLVMRGRRAYAYPTKTLNRWFPYLSDKVWSSKFMRAYSAFLVFGGFLIGLQGLIPYARRFRELNSVLVLVLVGVALAAAFLTLHGVKRHNRD
jgi:hypothetical protein